MIGEIKSLFELITNFRNWRKKSKDSALAVCKRVLRVFASVGISNMRAAEMVPKEFSVPLRAWSSPDELRSEMPAELTSWVSKTFAIEKGWLLEESGLPYQLVSGYKDQQQYFDFFGERKAEGDQSGLLTVITGAREPLSKEASGQIVVLYQQEIAVVGNEELYRYWCLAHDWWFGHPPCVPNLVALLAIANKFNVLIVGKLVSEPKITGFCDGKLLASELLDRFLGHWYPDDFLYPAKAPENEWHALARSSANEYLASDSLSKVRVPVEGIQLRLG